MISSFFNYWFATLAAIYRLKYIERTRAESHGLGFYEWIILEYLTFQIAEGLLPL